MFTRHFSNFIILISFMILFSFWPTYTASGAMTASQLDEIETAIKDTMGKSKTPVVSVSLIQQDHVEFISYSNLDIPGNLNPDSLFQIGSLSKAFTGLGILLLEDNGLLALNDPVRSHLPWFEVFYEGAPVKDEDLTISRLLYQTSGFTNEEVIFPRAAASVTLEEHVQNLSGSSLIFYPGTQYAYANSNYHILGLIIESVTGQSYQSFMQDHILFPLGLHHTYTDPQTAINTGNMISGSRLSYFQPQKYDIPVSKGNIPGGYIISSSSDMNRWMQINMGGAEPSEQFERVIEKAHQPNLEHAVDTNIYYAAGWFVNTKTGLLYHSGGTPNYSSKLLIRPDTETAICILTNMNASSNTIGTANSILNILDGKQPGAYSPDIWRIFDNIFSIITIVSITATLFILAVIIRIKGQAKRLERQRNRLSYKNIPAFFIPSVLILLTVVTLIIIPITFRSSWSGLLIWSPTSLTWGIVSFALLSISSLGLAVISSLYPNPHEKITARLEAN